MAAGSRDAPTTATEWGRKNGDREATVATRWRVSRRARPASVVRHRQVHVHLAALRPLHEGESRLPKHLKHRLIFGLRDRPEVREAVPHGHQGQPLQQQRAQSLTLEAVGHGQGHLGGPPVLRQVGAGRDDARLPALHASCHEG